MASAVTLVALLSPRILRLRWHDLSTPLRGLGLRRSKRRVEMDGLR
jgi:hypothetical protein